MKEFHKEIEVKMLFNDDQLQGTSEIFVKDGKVDYSNAEAHFYEIMRKWEKDWLKEAEEEEREFIIDNLTKEEEDKLQEKHAEQAEGVLDDDMPDDYENWLMELDLDDLKEILK